MKTLFLVVNTVCDLKCKDCFYANGYETRSRDRVTPDKIDTFLSSILELGFTNIVLTGGDPLCSKYKGETYELIKALKDNGLRVIVNTSAVKFDENDLDKIVELKIDRLDVSINSLSPDVHNYERGRFHETVWAIEGLLQRGYSQIVTTTVISERNAHLAAKTLEWLLRIGVKDVYYQPLFLPQQEQDYTPIKRAMMECAKIAKRPYTKFYLAQCDAAYAGKSAVEGSSCQMGEGCLVCEANGELIVCFHRPDVVIGNLIENSSDMILRNVRRWEEDKAVGLACFGKHCVSLFDNAKSWEKAVNDD